MVDLREILGLIITDPLGAADAIDALADKLRAQAAAIRASQENPWKSPGGMVDRVKMSVRGPNGEIKQSIDTGENN